MLNRILVVMGMKTLRFPRSITISPGSFPGQESFGPKWMIKPTTSNTIPAIIRYLAISKIIKDTGMHE